MRPNLRGHEAAWFWPRVNKRGKCWLWTGAVTGSGYGAVAVEGRQERAHRVAMGYPDGDVLHRCGNRLCCRPAHLYIGDDKMNAADRERHGRTARHVGEENGMSKLTEAAVRDIRSGGDPKVLAQRYGVGVSHIYRIRRRERWSEVR